MFQGAWHGLGRLRGHEWVTHVLWLSVPFTFFILSDVVFVKCGQMGSKAASINEDSSLRASHINATGRDCFQIEINPNDSIIF